MNKNSVQSLFFKYLMPSIFGVLSTSVYILFDTIFIGNGIGEKGLAALNISIPVFNVFNSIGLMIGIGGSCLMSYYIGKKNYESAKDIFCKSFTISLMIGFLISIITLLFLKKIAFLLGANDENYIYVKNYLICIFPMSWAFLINQMLNIFLKNDKAVSLTMWGLIISSLSNIILDYLFIFIFKMDMFGAALATAISPLIYLFIIFKHFFKENSFLSLNFKIPNLKEIKSIFSYGFASFIIELSLGIMIFVFNIVISKKMGSIGISAYSIIANVALTFNSIFNGISQASQPIISLKFGEDNNDETLKALYLSQKTALIFGVLFFSLGIFFPNQIISLFGSYDKELVSIAKEGIQIYFIAFIFMGINSCSIIFNQATQQGQNSTILSLLRGAFGNILFIFLLPIFLGTKGIWLAVAASEMITFLISIYFLKSNNSIKKLTSYKIS